MDLEQNHVYELLRDIMCDGDKGELDHFLDHLADIVQDPANIKGMMAEWFVIRNKLGRMGTF